MITKYTSEVYLGPRTTFFGSNFVLATGTICGDRYVHAEFYNETQYPPGKIPAGFVRRSRLAFVRRYLRIRAER